MAPLEGPSQHRRHGPSLLFAELLRPLFAPTTWACRGRRLAERLLLEGSGLPQGAKGEEKMCVAFAL